MKKIAVILPGELPIPAVMGGAIETLVTYLLDENEKKNQLEFVVFNQSKYFERLNGISYHNTEIREVNTSSFNRFLYDKAWRYIRHIFLCKIPPHSSYMDGVIKILKKEHFDSILVEGNGFNAWRIYKALGIRSILHLHTDILNINTLNCTQIVDSCSKIICVSEYVARRVSEIQRNKTTIITVCLNCTDTEMFNTENRVRLRKKSRKQYGYKDNDIVFMYVGRVDPMKGVSEAIEAFLRVNIPNKKFVVVGGASFADKPSSDYVNAIKQTVSEHSDCMKMTGYVEHDKLPEIYSIADIMVMPSKFYEAAPLTNIESGCMGIRSIVSDRGGTSEYRFSNTISVSMDDDAVGGIEKAMGDQYIHLRAEKDRVVGLDSINSQYGREKYYERMLSNLIN